MEAYNSMIDGFAVSHKDFNENEFLYMDENHIIRDENGEEYETTWDVKSQMERFKIDWYICKNRTEIKTRIAINKAKLIGPDAVDYIDEANYMAAIEEEPNTRKILRALPFDDDGNQTEFSNQKGLTIENTLTMNSGCSQIAFCKRFEKKGFLACKKCPEKIYKKLNVVILIQNILIGLLCIAYFLKQYITYGYADVVVCALLSLTTILIPGSIKCYINSRR
jgi:hypothetical protein